MNKYNDLELSILSCVLQKPELMDKIILEDKHFIKHRKIWNFMKAFYKKFKTFDLTLMVAISKNKIRTIEYMAWIMEKEPAPSLFYLYQEQLIKMYNQNKKDKWIINKIFDCANELYVGVIELEEFEKTIKKIYKEAEQIFKKEE